MNTFIKLSVSLVALLVSMVAHAEMAVVNTVSKVDGAVSGFICTDGSYSQSPDCDVQTILYPIAGNVYAPVVDPRTGETLDTMKTIGSIEATVKFPASFFGLLAGPMQDLGASLPWSCDDCLLKFKNGSVFQRIDDMPMTGRAFTGLGPVEDPATTGTLSLRMAGCVGIKEISGTGSYANKVGTLCLNGTFRFDQNFNGQGNSNCSLVLHDPI